MVPVPVPLAPDVIESQLLPDVTVAVQGIVPVPVLDTLKVVAPASFVTDLLGGVTDSTGVGVGVGVGVDACVTVTSIGLPVAPVAVTCMVAVRADVLVFAVRLQLIVPVSVPLAPDVIVNQLLPDVKVAVQGIVPPPVFETLNVVVPATAGTSQLSGVTERFGGLVTHS